MSGTGKTSCPQCNSSDIEQDPARGESYCTKCGTVVESNCIVSEVQFEEGSRGGSHVIGQHVGESGSCRPTVGSMFGSGRESRQVTLSNARKKIRAVGEQLRLNNSCIDIAFNLYRRALQKRLTHGRKNAHVVAACIYITCRVEQTSHMLLDLSDVTQVNVYELGRTYLKLSSSLHINIPACDPCIYIVRFASKLNLGSKSHEIEMTAMRIAQRMKRDWIHFGRRPSGLCGSALLVAARLHDVHCSIKDIISAVKVCEATIRKRLTEFGDTPTSRLTLEEFMQVDLEGEEDPPCFKAAKLKKVKGSEGKESLVTIDESGTVINEEIESSVSSLRQQIDDELEKIRKKKQRFHPFASLARSSMMASEHVSTDVPVDEIALKEFLLQDTIDVVTQAFGEEVEIETSLTEPKVLSSLLPSASVLKISESPFKIPLSAPSHALKRKKSVSEDNFDQNKDGADAGILLTDDLDDEELDSYILSEDEAGIKRQIWEEVNADWIQDMAAKAAKRAEEEAEIKLKESKGELPPPKKKRKVKKRVVIQANSAGEAIEKMLQEKRISNKINYDVLRQLDHLDDHSGHPFDQPNSEKEERRKSDSGVESGCDFGSSSTSAAGSSTPKTPVTSSRRLPSIRNFVSSHIRLPPSSTRTRSRASSIASSFRDRRDSISSTTAIESINHEINAPGKENEVVGNEVAVSRPKDQSNESNNKRKREEETSQVLVQDSTVDDDEEEDLEEEEEVNEAQLSITQLMSQRMGEVNTDNEEDGHMTDQDDY